MITVATRLATLHVLGPPTQGEVFRGIVGPVLGSGGTAGSLSFTIPSDTEGGDLLFVTAFAAHYSIQIDYPVGWDYYYGLAFYSEEAIGDGPYPGGTPMQIYKVAAGDVGEISSDAGDTVTFDFSFTASSGGINGDPYDGDTIGQLLVLRNEIITPSYTFDNNKVETSYNDFNGTSTPAAPTVGSITTTTIYEILIYMSASHALITCAASDGVLPLCDVSNSTISLYLGWKAHPSASATGIHIILQSGTAYSICSLIGIPSNL